MKVGDKLDIGDLNQRITLLKPINSVDNNGFEIDSYYIYKKVWAKVSNLRGKEYFFAEAIKAEQTVKFTIRYQKDIDTTMKILFRGKTYDINSIDNINYENRWIEIKALEVIPSG